MRLRELLKATDFVSRVSNGFREEVDLDWKDLEARWASDFGETEECRKRGGKPGNGFIQGSGESRVRSEKENVGGAKVLDFGRAVAALAGMGFGQVDWVFKIRVLGGGFSGGVNKKKKASG